MLGTKFPGQSGIFGNRNRTVGLDQKHFSGNQCRLETRSLQCLWGLWPLSWGARECGLVCHLVEWDWGNHFHLKSNNNIMWDFYTLHLRTGLASRARTRTHGQKGLVLGLELCCCHIEIPGFWSRDPTFSFHVLGPANYITSPVREYAELNSHLLHSILDTFYTSTPPDLNLTANSQ